VIATLFLLVSAAMASAECAWVLWVESGRVGEGAPPGGFTGWDVKDGCEKRADCVKRLGAVEQESRGLITPQARIVPCATMTFDSLCFSSLL